MGDETALVIDTQLGMFETLGVPPVPKGERLLGKIEGLIRGAREAGAMVVHIQHAGGPGHPLGIDTERWEIHPRVAPADGKRVLGKETPGCFLGTVLQNVLGRGR